MVQQAYDPNQRDALRRGILDVPGARVDVIAPNASTLLYSMSLNRKGRIVRLQCANNTGSTVWLLVGTVTGGVFTQVMKFRLVSGFDRTIEEHEIPGVRFSQDIYVQVDVAAAHPADVCIFPEVMELRGISG